VTADRIQARAIRRCGQLLSEIKTKQGARSDLVPSETRSKAARKAGLSHRQQHTSLRVARVNGEEFEGAVESAMLRRLDATRRAAVAWLDKTRPR